MIPPLVNMTRAENCPPGPTISYVPVKDQPSRIFRLLKAPYLNYKLFDKNNDRSIRVQFFVDKTKYYESTLIVKKI